MSDRLERHSLLMMSATLAGHAGNYAFHLFSGRGLSAGDYGLLVAVLGVLNIAALPASAFTVSLSRAVAADWREHKGANVRALLARWGNRAAVAAVAGVGLVALVFGGRNAVWAAAGALVGFNFLLVVTGAGLQGSQQFGGLAARSGLLHCGRAVLAGLWVWMGMQTTGWMLAAHAAGMAAALAVSLGALLPRLPQSAPRRGNARPPVLLPALGALPCLLAFAVLMSADVILARRFFPGEADDFARAAVIGRMILWLPLPIASAMFPKVVSPAPKTLLKAVAYTLVLVLAALLACRLGAAWLLRLLYGVRDPDPRLLDLVWRMGLAMAPLGVAHVVLHHELAQSRARTLWPILLAASLYLLAVAVHHPRVAFLVQALTLATLTALGNALWILWRRTRVAAG